MNHRLQKPQPVLWHAPHNDTPHLETNLVFFISPEFACQPCVFLAFARLKFAPSPLLPFSHIPASFSRNPCLMLLKQCQQGRRRRRDERGYFRSCKRRGGGVLLIVSRRPGQKLQRPRVFPKKWRVFTTPPQTTFLSCPYSRAHPSHEAKEKTCCQERGGKNYRKKIAAS